MQNLSEHDQVIKDEQEAESVYQDDLTTEAAAAPPETVTESTATSDPVQEAPAAATGWASDDQPASEERSAVMPLPMLQPGQSDPVPSDSPEPDAVGYVATLDDRYVDCRLEAGYYHHSLIDILCTMRAEADKKYGPTDKHARQSAEAEFTAIEKHFEDGLACLKRAMERFKK